MVGWTDAKLLQCEWGCGHCQVCTDGLLPSQQSAQEFQAKRDRIAEREVQREIQVTHELLLNDLRSGAHRNMRLCLRGMT